MEQTIGQKLKQIREIRGISLEEIAERTRIRLVYLQAIEENDLEVLPSPMQMRGFLRLYANELGVEIESLKVGGYHLFKEEETPSPDSEMSAPAEPEPTEPQETPVEAETQPEHESDQDDLQDVLKPSIEEPGETPVSADYFIQIGEKLKERRNLLSLSLEDIKANLHIRQYYIESIESGHFEDLPSPVQAKGMLSNYAEFLNLDADSLLLEFAEALQKQRLEKTTAPKKRRKAAKEISPASLKLRNFFSLDLLVIATIFIGFAAFVIWGVNRIMAVDSSETETTSLPEVADILLATSSPTQEITPTPETATPSEDEDEENEEDEDTTEATETPIFTSAASASAINIVVVPLQRVWVQVNVDSEMVYEGRLVPGNAYDYSGTEVVEILTGNAAGIQIYFNDEDLGEMGLIGEVSDLIFTSSGLVLPTATITPTPTETPLISPTPTITSTPSPTATESND